MSRLLFAAARGARIQLKVNQNVPWSEVHSGFIPILESVHYRIHPEDEAYQYGPISTALREAATQEIDYLQDATDVYGGAVIKDYENYGELGYCWDRARNSTTMHKSLFLLILAEALADSGL